MKYASVDKAIDVKKFSVTRNTIHLPHVFGSRPGYDIRCVTYSVVLGLE